MKITKAQAAENREKLLVQAAKLFRERGICGVGVDALAAAADMTHGSLYSQFGSKDKVLAEALVYGAAKIRARGAGLQSISEAIAGYVSPMHRDNPGSGCFMATLGCEMPRQSEEVRGRFTDMVKGNIERLATLLPNGRKQRREDEVLSILATMVGAVTLSRAIDDAELSDRILAVTRKQLLERQASRT